MKKLLTIADLHDYYRKQGKSVSFSSKDSDSAIVVHVKEPFKFSSSEDNDLYLKTNLRFCHTEENVNESFISQKTMADALKTVYNMPILGYIWDDNGTPKFAGHEFYEDENGETVYEEIPIGVVPESSPLEFVSNDNGKTYLEGTGLIWKTYSKAAEILEREDNLSVSIEILVDDLSYDQEKDVLVFNKIRFTGVTILQEDPDSGKEILPGMQGAEISIEDFSIKNNSIFAKEEIKKFIQESIKEAMNIYSQRKEENNQMNHFEELLEKYGKTVDEIAFAYEGLSDEELDAAFAEAFEETPEPENPVSPEETMEYSITYNGETKTFAKSINEQIREISELVNATYGAEDNAIYECEVFDDKTVLFHDWWNNKHFKQKYGNKEGNLVLKGERTELFVRYLTEDEITALDELKTKFDAQAEEFEKVSKELDLYKAEPDKIELLNLEDYSTIKNTAEYAELSKRENYFSLSKEEIEAKLDNMLVNFAKNYGKEHKEETPAPVGLKRFGFGDSETRNNRYGGVFDKN